MFISEIKSKLFQYFLRNFIHICILRYFFWYSSHMFQNSIKDSSIDIFGRISVMIFHIFQKRHWEKLQTLFNYIFRNSFRHFCYCSINSNKIFKKQESQLDLKNSYSGSHKSFSAYYLETPNSYFLGNAILLNKFKMIDNTFSREFMKNLSISFWISSKII